MNIRNLIAASAAIAALGFGSVAHAAMTEQTVAEPDGVFAQLSGGVADFFSPRYQLDGTVYGVLPRQIINSRNLPSLQILHNWSRPSAAIVPGACSTAAGWCDTPHNIASSAFGWNFAYKGAGAVVGIVDTGIDLNHPEFAGRVLTGGCIVSSLNACTNAWDKVGGDTATFPGPNSTHGTHVAGIAAGANVGIASQADILPVKVCSSGSSGCSGVTEGVVYASQHGADVINVSIGGPILSNSDIAGFRTAIGNGSLLVVAAGNAGTRYPTGRLPRRCRDAGRRARLNDRCRGHRLRRNGRVWQDRQFQPDTRQSLRDPWRPPLLHEGLFRRRAGLSHLVLGW